MLENLLMYDLFDKDQIAFLKREHNAGDLNKELNKSFIEKIYLEGALLNGK